MGDAARSSGEAGSAAATGVGLGAGLGMGVGMAGMISQAMSSAMQPAASGAPPAAGTSQPPAAPDVMNLDEAAAYLKVTPADVQGLITSGQVRAKQIGTEYRISKKALDDFLSS